MSQHPSSALRRTVLAVALTLALVVSGVWRPDAAEAQSASPPAKSAAGTPASTSTTAPSAATTAAPAASGAPSTGDSADSASPAESKDGRGPAEVIIEKNGKRVRIKGLHRSSDPNMDEFNQFLENQPAFAGMVVAIVAIVFLSPVFIVGLVITYRIRKARLLNETMLKLAERGVVPPAEAMQALGAGQLPASVTEPVITSTGAITGPSLLEQARGMRSRAAWSDLRKGILVGAVGLGFTVHEVWRAGRPGTVGLILLFIGLGYCVLWWYETRQLTPPANTAGTPGSGT